MTTDQPPPKPTPSTFEFYTYADLETYLFAVNPKALWVIRGCSREAAGKFINVDVADMESDARRFHDSYHEGAAESVAWFRREFGDLVTVRR
jgi:hypothetical protein